MALKKKKKKDEAYHPSLAPKHFRQDPSEFAKQLTLQRDDS